jgi:hypothetical protein
LSVPELADVEALLIWVVEVRKVGGVGDSLAWAARLPPTLTEIHFVQLNRYILLRVKYK